MKHFFLLLLLILGVAAGAARAQGPGSGGPRPAATTVPIDGGASLLAAGAVAYGLRTLRQRRRRA